MHPADALLNELVDESLPAGERDAVERHLAGCDRCRSLVADLRELRRAARALGSVPPPAGAWPRVAAAIARRPRRFTFVHGLAAAAVLAVAAAAGLRVGSRPAQTPAQTDAAAPTPAELAETVETELQQAEQHYQRAISGLEQIARTQQGELDPQTAAMLQKNLAVIDQAISESRAALKVEPDSEPAQQSLLDSFKQKVALLQDTVALINEMRKGDEAGAARIVSGAQ